MKKVIAWSVCVVWEDNTEETIDVPDWAAEDLNTYLDELQEERSKEGVTNDSN
jgi:hypothetical protein